MVTIIRPKPRTLTVTIFVGVELNDQESSISSHTALEHVSKAQGIVSCCDYRRLASDYPPRQLHGSHDNVVAIV